jgi:formylglycine-generating enzyme required for sulfatase activity
MIEFNNKVEAGKTSTISLGNDTLLTLVWCPAGEFERRHLTNYEVSLRPEKAEWQEVILTSGFWIAQTPVTQEQWLRFMPKESLLEYIRGDFPAVLVNWLDAKKFCQLATDFLRQQGFLSTSQTVLLPTEAQWEYACRAGTKSKWYFGENEEDLVKHAWYRENAQLYTSPVKSKLPNPWGLYDVYGNVAEWCEDTYHFYSPEKVVENPISTLNSTSKVVRGGSAYTVAQVCTSASRFSAEIQETYEMPVGIRVIISNQ